MGAHVRELPTMPTGWRAANVFPLWHTRSVRASTYSSLPRQRERAEQIPPYGGWMRIGGCFVCATGPCQNKPWRPWRGCPILYSFRYASVASSGGKVLSFIPRRLGLAWDDSYRLPLLADTKPRGWEAPNGGAFPALSPVGGGNLTLEACGGELEVRLFVCSSHALLL